MRNPLPLAFLGHPILRQRAEPIETINADIRAFGEELLFAMLHYDGLGLAAPQVHRSIRMFAMRGYNLDGKGNPIWKESRLILNPVLIHPSKETEFDEEGCLSIPGLRGMVERPYAITLEGIDIEGNAIHERFEGIEARIVMHETDHLNGRFFHERMSKRDREMFERRIKTKQHLFEKQNSKKSFG